MTHTALDPRSQAVLRALYELAGLDIPAHAGAVSRALALAGQTLGAADVARVLLVLDARGLAVAERARLSLRGLAEALRCPGLGLERLAASEQERRRLRGPALHAAKPGPARVRASTTPKAS